MFLLYILFCSHSLFSGFFSIYIEKKVYIMAQIVNASTRKGAYLYKSMHP